MTLLIAISIYLFLCGMTYPFVLNSRVRNCVWSRHPAGLSSKEEMQYKDDRDHHKLEAVWYSLGAPVAIPFVVGSMITNRNDKELKRRADEIAEAKHRKKIASINAETLALQEREAGLTD